MDKPLGRDRLGRLVYQYDNIRLMYSCDAVAWTVMKSMGLEIYVDHKRNDGRIESLIAPGDLLEVDLASSPRMNNYQRYFADLGTLDYINVCYVESVSQANDDDLFWFEFEHDLWWHFDHANFKTWLNMEATV